jgi:hypothetical protein
MGTMTHNLRENYAKALYVDARAQDDDPAGRTARRRALEEATAVLAGASAESRQLRPLRELSEQIAKARVAP